MILATFTTANTSYNERHLRQPLVALKISLALKALTANIYKIQVQHLWICTAEQSCFDRCVSTDYKH